MRGFTLIELIASMVLMSVLAISLASAWVDAGQRVQVARDDLIAALFSAQQLAMARSDGVRLIVSAEHIDIRIDADGDALFSGAESVSAGGVQYPLNFPAGVSATAAVFDYDRLGRTAAAAVTLRGPRASAGVTVADSGYAY